MTKEQNDRLLELGDRLNRLGALPHDEMQEYNRLNRLAVEDLRKRERNN